MLEEYEDCMVKRPPGAVVFPVRPTVPQPVVRPPQTFPTNTGGAVVPASSSGAGTAPTGNSPFLLVCDGKPKQQCFGRVSASRVCLWSLKENKCDDAQLGTAEMCVGFNAETCAEASPMCCWDLEGYCDKFDVGDCGLFPPGTSPAGPVNSGTSSTGGTVVTPGQSASNGASTGTKGANTPFFHPAGEAPEYEDLHPGQPEYEDLHPGQPEYEDLHPEAEDVYPLHPAHRSNTVSLLYDVIDIPDVTTCVNLTPCFGKVSATSMCLPDRVTKKCTAHSAGMLTQQKFPTLLSNTRIQAPPSSNNDHDTYKFVVPEPVRHYLYIGLFGFAAAFALGCAFYSLCLCRQKKPVKENIGLDQRPLV